MSNFISRYTDKITPFSQKINDNNQINIIITNLLQDVEIIDNTRFYSQHSIADSLLSALESLENLSQLNQPTQSHNYDEITAMQLELTNLQKSLKTQNPQKSIPEAGILSNSQSYITYENLNSSDDYFSYLEEVKNQQKSDLQQENEPKCMLLQSKNLGEFSDEKSTKGEQIRDVSSSQGQEIDIYEFSDEMDQVQSECNRGVFGQVQQGFDGDWGCNVVVGKVLKESQVEQINHQLADQMAVLVDTGEIRHNQCEQSNIMTTEQTQNDFLTSITSSVQSNVITKKQQQRAPIITSKLQTSDFNSQTEQNSITNDNNYQNENINSTKVISNPQITNKLPTKHQIEQQNEQRQNTSESSIIKPKSPQLTDTVGYFSDESENSISLAQNSTFKVVFRSKIGQDDVKLEEVSGENDNLQCDQNEFCSEIQAKKEQKIVKSNEKSNEKVLSGENKTKNCQDSFVNWQILDKFDSIQPVKIEQIDGKSQISDESLDNKDCYEVFVKENCQQNDQQEMENCILQYKSDEIRVNSNEQNEQLHELQLAEPQKTDQNMIEMSQKSDFCIEISAVKKAESKLNKSNHSYEIPVNQLQAKKNEEKQVLNEAQQMEIITKFNTFKSSNEVKIDAKVRQTNANMISNKVKQCQFKDKSGEVLIQTIGHDQCLQNEFQISDLASKNELSDCDNCDFASSTINSSYKQVKQFPIQTAIKQSKIQQISVSENKISSQVSQKSFPIIQKTTKNLPIQKQEKYSSETAKIVMEIEEVQQSGVVVPQIVQGKAVGDQVRDNIISASLDDNLAEFNQNSQLDVVICNNDNIQSGTEQQNYQSQILSNIEPEDIIHYRVDEIQSQYAQQNKLTSIASDNSQAVEKQKIQSIYEISSLSDINQADISQNNQSNNLVNSLIIEETHTLRHDTDVSPMLQTNKQNDITSTNFKNKMLQNIEKADIKDSNFVMKTAVSIIKRKKPMRKSLNSLLNQIYRDLGPVEQIIQYRPIKQIIDTFSYDELHDAQKIAKQLLSLTF